MDERAEGLGAFIDARSGSLLRFAYLLTGDHDLAEDLLQNSLIKVYLSWNSIRDRGALEAPRHVGAAAASGACTAVL